MEKLKAIKVRIATHDELDALVDMHLKCFPGYYLTHLGRGIVRETYDQYFKSNLLVPIVAMSEGRVIGFISGTYPGGSIEVDFWQKNFYRVVWRMILGLMRLDGVIWRGLLNRLGRIPKAVKRKFVKQSDEANSVGMSLRDEENVGWLVSIAVLPEARGCGVAQKMMDCFVSLEVLRGVKHIRLCVYKNNVRATAFYEKAGFSRVKESKLLYTYQKIIVK